MELGCYTINEVCSRLSCSESDVDRLIQSKRLNPVRIAGNLLFDVSEIPGIKLEKIAQIEKIIADAFRCRISDMHEQTRRQPVVTARQFVIWYLDKIYCRKNNIKLSKADIARHFHKDHATGLYATRTIDGFIQVDKRFRQFSEMLVKKLEEV